MQLVRLYANGDEWLEFTAANYPFCMFSPDMEVEWDYSNSVRGVEEYLVPLYTNPFKTA